MTREKLVRQKAQEFASRGEYSPALTESFVAGAEWEHKRLIEKACEWLDNINPDDYMDSGIFQIYDLIGNLRKAMED